MVTLQIGQTREHNSINDANLNWHLSSKKQNKIDNKITKATKMFAHNKECRNQNYECKNIYKRKSVENIAKVEKRKKMANRQIMRTKQKFS